MCKKVSSLENSYNQIMRDLSVLESISKNNEVSECYSCHGIYHTLYVEKEVKKILEKIGETKENIMLGEIAARFHDIGCLDGKKNHAKKSYEITKCYLDKYNFKSKQKEIVLQAILDHSKGEEIKTNVGAALLLADKIHISKERVILDKAHVNYFNINNLLIDKVDLNIDNKNIHVNFLVDKGYDPFSLSYWPKCIEIPEKVAKFMNRKCIFYINNKIVDFNKFILKEV